MEELLALTEKSAENVHDVWAVGRIAEGWTYGPVKDLEKKTTSQMVAYDELPEGVKEYERNTVQNPDVVEIINCIGIFFPL